MAIETKGKKDKTGASASANVASANVAPATATGVAAATLDGEMVNAGETAGTSKPRGPRGPSFHWFGGSDEAARMKEVKRAMRAFARGEVTAPNGDPKPLTLGNLLEHLKTSSAEFQGPDVEHLTELKLGSFIRFLRANMAEEAKKGRNVVPLPPLVTIRGGRRATEIDWSAE